MEVQRFINLLDSTGFFREYTSPATLSVHYVGINKDSGKRIPQLYYVNLINVLLTSELPWQHNNSITFFTFLFISR